MTDTVAPWTSAPGSQAAVPYSLKDAPALIERLLPVQKLSAESYKEQMAGSNKTLTALGSFWKGPQAAHSQQGVHSRLSASGER